MLRRLSAIIILSLCSAGALASDAGFRPSFHPDQLKGPPAGRHNEVLVLGTAHLSELPKTFEPALLEPLLQRLARWRPEAIATENLSGLQCDFMRRNPSRYAESVETYCFDTDAARVATGLDVPSANAEMGRLLSAWPASPTAAQRRHLAAVFLAAGERGSAQVQWLRLPVQDRIAGDGLDAALVEILDKSLTRRNETNLVAAVLAARLGLERLWAVDDHTADSPTPPEDKKAAREAMMKAWDNPHANARRDADKPLYANIGKVDGVLDLYRAYNRPDVGLQAYTRRTSARRWSWRCSASQVRRSTSPPTKSRCRPGPTSRSMRGCRTDRVGAGGSRWLPPLITAACTRNGHPEGRSR